MVRSVEVALVRYMLNALWQVPLLYGAARLGDWLLCDLDVRYRHRLWVGALVLEGLLPAASARTWPELHVVRLWFTGKGPHATGLVQVVQGGGVAAGGILIAPVVFRVVLAVYLAFLLFFAARLVWNVGRLAAIRRAATPLALTPVLQQTWQACLDAFALTAVALQTSPLTGSPVTVGIRYRTVMAPPGFLEKLTSADLFLVFAHECAHMKRYDYGWNLLYEVLVLPIAFHPGLWITRKRMVESREWVCDALAASAGAGNAAYTRSLLRLATQLLAAGPAKVPHAIGILDANALERRLMQLTMSPRIISPLRRFALLTACGLLVFGAAVSAVALPAPMFVGQQGTTVPPQKPAPSRAARIPGSVMAGNLTSRVNPTYPADARAAHIQGSVVLAALIGRDGTIENLTVSSGPPELSGSAADAVRQWTYKPFLLNGKPVEVQTTITVNYQLAD